MGERYYPTLQICHLVFAEICDFFFFCLYCQELNPGLQMPSVCCTTEPHPQHCATFIYLNHLVGISVVFTEGVHSAAIHICVLVFIWMYFITSVKYLPSNEIVSSVQ